MTSLPPGPELDRLVAEACGFKVAIKVTGVGKWECRVEHYDGPLWAPSTDANDALLAAEKFGLFDPQFHGDHRYILGRCVAGTRETRRVLWCVQDLDPESDKSFVSTAETAAHAICLAILALKESTHATT